MPSSRTNWHQWPPSETWNWTRSYTFLSNNTKVTVVKQRGCWSHPKSCMTPFWVRGTQQSMCPINEKPWGGSWDQLGARHLLGISEALATLPLTGRPGRQDWHTFKQSLNKQQKIRMCGKPVPQKYPKQIEFHLYVSHDAQTVNLQKKNSLGFIYQS